jgi:hypothetical protein
MPLVQLDFTEYVLPTSGADLEIAERIEANNVVAAELAQLWAEYQSLEKQATSFLRCESLEGVTYQSMQALHASGIDVALEIVRKQAGAYEETVRLLELLAASSAMLYAESHRRKIAITQVRNRCSAFAGKIRQHLGRTLFADLWFEHID